MFYAPDPDVQVNSSNFIPIRNINLHEKATVFLGETLLIHSWDITMARECEVWKDFIFI